MGVSVNFARGAHRGGTERYVRVLSTYSYSLQDEW
jgi:hypothetical protein